MVELDAAAQQLEDRRQGAHVDVALAAGGDDAAAQLAGRRGDRDHDLVGLRLVEDPVDLGRWCPSTLTPCRRMPRLRGSSSRKPIALVAEVRVELQLADDHLAARAGADDEDVAAPLPAACAAAGRSMIIRASEPGAADQ